MFDGQASVKEKTMANGKKWRVAVTGFVKNLGLIVWKGNKFASFFPAKEEQVIG